MTRQAIDIGAAANDGTGDPLRTAMDKSNDNFVELYQAPTVLGYALARQNAGIASSGGVRTQITIDTTDEDSNSIVSGNTFVVPTGANWDFAVVSLMVTAAQAATGVTPRIEILRNATTLTAGDPDGGAFADWSDAGTELGHSLVFPVAVADGDVFRFYWESGNGAGVYAAMSIIGYGRRETP
jgi:hypothetical protein